MKNHFIFSYKGNKRQEVEKLYNLIDFKNVKNIIEPCCGSFALSYYISTLHPKKYSYVLNDINPFLIELLKLIKSGKYKKFENKINKYLDKINNKYTGTTNLKEFASEWKELYKNNDLFTYLITRKHHGIGREFIPPMRLNKNGELPKLKLIKFREYPVYRFLRDEHIIFKNVDVIDIIKEYGNNKKNLIFLDPPYLSLCNSFYNSGKNGTDGNTNIYEYLFKNPINKMKSKIYLILEDNWIIRLLFEKSGYIIDKNNKLYEISKKSTSHITISNIIKV